jgi:hypothetical protein
MLIKEKIVHVDSKLDSLRNEEEIQKKKAFLSVTLLDRLGSSVVRARG